MHARTNRLSAIGVAVGLVLAVTTAIAPATAAKPGPSAPVTSSSVGCSYFDGLTVTGSPVAQNSVALRAGDVITATVSPARTGDTIFLSAPIGLNFSFYDSPATSGLTFVAPADALYSMTWTLKTAATIPADLTWSFTSSCSSTVVSPTPPADTKPGKGRGKK